MTINAMMLGATVMASFIVALFFLRFWRSTSDRFFLLFALSFFIDALDHLFFSSPVYANGNPVHYYVIRLISYGFILWAIIDKNWVKSSAKHDKRKQHNDGI